MYEKKIKNLLLKGMKRTGNTNSWPLYYLFLFKVDENSDCYGNSHFQQKIANPILKSVLEVLLCTLYICSWHKLHHKLCLFFHSDKNSGSHGNLCFPLTSIVHRLQLHTLFIFQVLATTRLMPAPATETTAMVPEVHTEQGFRITRVAVPIDAAVVLPANGPDQPDTLTDVIVEDAMLPPSPLRDLSPVRVLGPEVTPTLLRQSPVVESPTESVETEPDLSLRLDDTDDADGDSVMAGVYMCFRFFYKKVC